MSMQQVMRWGHDFPKDREGDYLNPWVNGENPNVKERTHQTSTTHFVFFPQSLNSTRMWLS